MVSDPRLCLKERLVYLPYKAFTFLLEKKVTLTWNRALIFILLLPELSDTPLRKGVCVTLLFQLYLHNSKKKNAKMTMDDYGGLIAFISLGLHVKNIRRKKPSTLDVTDRLNKNKHICNPVHSSQASIFIKTTLSSRKYSVPESCKSYHQQKLLEMLGHSLKLHY